MVFNILKSVNFIQWFTWMLCMLNVLSNRTKFKPFQVLHQRFNSLIYSFKFNTLQQCVLFFELLLKPHNFIYRVHLKKEKKKKKKWRKTKKRRWKSNGRGLFKMNEEIEMRKACSWELLIQVIEMWHVF